MDPRVAYRRLLSARGFLAGAPPVVEALAADDEPPATDAGSGGVGEAVRPERGGKVGRYG